jgi:hypothetical protein
MGPSLQQAPQFLIQAQSSICRSIVSEFAVENITELEWHVFMGETNDNGRMKLAATDKVVSKTNLFKYDTIGILYKHSSGCG